MSFGRLSSSPQRFHRWFTYFHRCDKHQSKSLNRKRCFDTNTKYTTEKTLRISWKCLRYVSFFNRNFTRKILTTDYFSLGILLIARVCTYCITQNNTYKKTPFVYSIFAADDDDDPPPSDRMKPRTRLLRTVVVWRTIFFHSSFLDIFCSSVKRDSRRQNRIYL